MGWGSVWVLRGVADHILGLALFPVGSCLGGCTGGASPPPLYQRGLTGTKADSVLWHTIQYVQRWCRSSLLSTSFLLFARGSRGVDGAPSAPTLLVPEGVEYIFGLKTCAETATQHGTETKSLVSH